MFYVNLHPNFTEFCLAAYPYPVCILVIVVPKVYYYMTYPSQSLYLLQEEEILTKGRDLWMKGPNKHVSKITRE